MTKNKDFIAIALDALGSDQGPDPLVQGGLEALAGNPRLELVLVGIPADLEKSLDKFDGRWRSNKSLKIEPSSQAPGMGEGAFSIAKKRRDSSVARCLELLKNGSVNGALSAGSTAASVYWALEILGPYPNETMKPAIPIPWPHADGFTVLIDGGATPDADARQIAHFAVLGSLYAKIVIKRERVRVGLMSIGEERTKGNLKIKEAYGLIKAVLGNEFAGMVEGRDLPMGRVDVVACDAFLGNIMLKLGEGFAAEAGRMLKKNLNWLGLIGALLMLPSLKKLKKRLSWEAVGGAPLLGVKGNFFISHGRASPKAISSALSQCLSFAASGAAQTIEAEYQKHYAHFFNPAAPPVRLAS